MQERKEGRKVPGGGGGTQTAGIGLHNIGKLELAGVDGAEVVASRQQSSAHQPLSTHTRKEGKEKE